MIACYPSDFCVAACETALTELMLTCFGVGLNVERVHAMLPFRAAGQEGSTGYPPLPGAGLYRRPGYEFIHFHPLDFINSLGSVVSGKKTDRRREKLERKREREERKERERERETERQRDRETDRERKE